MHPDLEALIQLYDAAMESGPQAAAARRDAFEKRLQDVLSRTPGVSEEAFRKAIRLAHRQWLLKRQKPPTLPPQA